MAEGVTDKKDPVAPAGGWRLGSYVLGRKLGVGGMATVYAARHIGAHATRLVALKVLNSSIVPEDREHAAFLREARVAMRLEHPNIVRTYDVGEVDGRMYLAMELVHGASLAACQKVAIVPTPLPVAVRIISEVARALHAAHELVDVEGHLGLVHQDISPQNVLVSYDGQVKLVDFGVARLGTREGSQTASVKGKPSYLSPEQLSGKNIDRRTDIFALGIIFWELLTGSRLFKRETTAATYLAVIQEPIVDVQHVNLDVPPQVADVITMALERDRDIRFATADALRRTLAAACGACGVREATQEDVAAWVSELVPPMSVPADLEREIVTDSSPVNPRLAAPVDATLRVDMVPGLERPPAPPPAPVPSSSIPDLDLPLPPPARPSQANLQAARASSGSMPVKQTLPSQSAPDLGPSIRVSAAPSSNRSIPVSAPPPSAPRTSIPSHGVTNSAAPGREIAIDTSDDDDFDMQLERGSGGMAPMPTTSGRPSGMGPSRSPSSPSLSGAQRVAGTGLELGAPVRASARRAPARDHAGVAGLLLGYAVATLVGGILTALLLKLAHAPAGIDVTRILPHAFDGSSAPESGVVALVLLGTAVGVGFVGLRLEPHAWAIVGSGAAIALLALAMVTVTLASTGENPTPPDGVLLVPYLLPAAGALLGIGVLGRAGRRFANAEGVGRALVVPLAFLAAVILFLTVETSRLGR